MTHPRGIMWPFKMRAKRLVMGRSRFDRAPWTKIGRNLERDWTIVEAGAYDGTDTRVLADLVPYGHVFAFEPNPEAFTRLAAVAQAKSNVSATQAALGPKSGQGTLHVAHTGNHQMAPSSSLLEPSGHLSHFPHVSFSSSVDISLLNLDDFLRLNPPGTDLFLWLDLQGMELDVLISSPEAMIKTRMIYTEVALQPLYRGASAWKELDTFLRDHSFTAIDERVGRVSGNALYIR